MGRSGGWEGVKGGVGIEGRERDKVKGMEKEIEGGI